MLSARRNNATNLICCLRFRCCNPRVVGSDTARYQSRSSVRQPATYAGPFKMTVKQVPVSCYIDIQRNSP
jgi:hypothetical protein